jgi:transposase
MLSLATTNRTAEAAGFKKMLAWIVQHIDCDAKEVLFAFEHTGLYSLPLSLFLHERQHKFTLLPGLELKKSMGISRGKNDKQDAKRIAEYAYEKKSDRRSGEDQAISNALRYFIKAEEIVILSGKISQGKSCFQRSLKRIWHLSQSRRKHCFI